MNVFIFIPEKRVVGSPATVSCWYNYDILLFYPKDLEDIVDWIQTPLPLYYIFVIYVSF